MATVFQRIYSLYQYLKQKRRFSGSDYGSDALKPPASGEPFWRLVHAEFDPKCVEINSRATYKRKDDDSGKQGDAGVQVCHRSSCCFVERDDNLTFFPSRVSRVSERGAGGKK